MAVLSAFLKIHHRTAGTSGKLPSNYYSGVVMRTAFVRKVVRDMLIKSIGHLSHLREHLLHIAEAFREDLDRKGALTAVIVTNSSNKTHVGHLLF